MTRTMTLAHNRPSLDDLCADPAAALKGQPLEVIAILMDEAKARRDSGALALKLIQGALETRYGTALGAVYQAADHGTAPRGDGHPRRKLTADQVHAIRGRMGEDNVTLGQEFGVHPTHVQAIKARRFWSHLPEARPCL